MLCTAGLNTSNLQKDVPLAPLTTLRVGGNARFFVRAMSESDVIDAVEFARGEGIGLFVLGGGSNVLISDNGFDGLVLQVSVPGVSVLVDGVLSVGAGEDWDSFVAYCVENGMAGVECLSGIPGFVGGTPVQNVGAYGQEVSETIVSVRCLDLASGDVVTLANSDCGFSYRTSIFNTTDRGRYIVLNVTYALKSGGHPRLVYKDLSEHFGDSEPSISEVRDAVLSIRRSKSMVIDEADPNSRSAGSFFKNPLIERSMLAELEAGGAPVPYFDAGEKVKIPAAWLIGRAGFSKGYILGNAGISLNHNLALINRGGASADELMSLQRKIRDAVHGQFGIELVPEPVFVGFKNTSASNS